MIVQMASLVTHGFLGTDLELWAADCLSRTHAAFLGLSELVETQDCHNHRGLQWH
jgi:hypothetical protein